MTPSPSVDPVRERIAEMTGQKYLDQHDAGLLGAALTAALGRIQQLQQMGYGSASDYDKGGLRAANEIRAAIAAGLGVTP